MTTTVRDIVTALDALAPFRLAEPWDNVGLLLGDEGDAVAGPILLTIDLTREVFDEAREMNASCVVAYHPVLFRETKRVTRGTPRGGLLLDLLRAGISVVSPHTALDAAAGGMADWLMEGVGDGKGDRRALSPHVPEETGGARKIVTFVPEANLEAVRDAMAAAGAGVIGAYDTCSYVSVGRGTFRGGEGANPVIGERGRLETVAEARLEMVCPATRLAAAVDALRRTHPYEEPAFDVYALAGAPDWSIGSGRWETLAGPATVEEVAWRVRRHLGIEVVKVATAPGPGVVRRAGVCPGAGSSLLDAAIGAGCDVFITGEMQHHQALAALERGCSVILAGHTNTERGYLPTLALRLTQSLAEVDVRVSVADESPFRYLT